MALACLVGSFLAGCVTMEGDAPVSGLYRKADVSAGASRGTVLPNGDFVFENVPVEVQESPRHCAAASLARALAWEGVQIPQSNLALYGGVTAEGGVRIDDFYDALRPLFSDYDLQLQTHFRLDASAALARGERHNALARADGLPLLTLPRADSDEPVVLEALYRGADPTCLRLATRPGRNRFFETVVSRIRAGHPLLWGVVLGVIPEPGVLQPGGHLRLIVGYNPEEQTILYSDPWGPDCPVKTMDVADAWAITMSLDSLEPADRAR